MISIIKINPIIRIVSGSLIELPSPVNISSLWNFGSLLGLCLVIQILTGLFLAIHYTDDVTLAFERVRHIVRDVNYGWLLRIFHANGARFFFICIYIHVGRGLYYFSYYFIHTWIVGVIILFAVIAAAFLGYVLPWGQISFWGATVITNLFSAIPLVGESIVYWLWGGFAVDNATLNRFFSLHYLLPFVIAGAVFLHLAVLHHVGSGNPLGIDARVDLITFYPYYYTKDVVAAISFGLFFGLFVFFAPNMLGHPDNYIPANPMVTPTHIVPEWYFLPFYAVLRSIPNKLGGVIAMVAAILILAIIPFINTSVVRSSYFRLIFKKFYWLLIVDCIILTWIGGQVPEEPYILIGQLATLYYFFYFCVCIPVIGRLEAILMKYYDLNEEMNELKLLLQK